MRPNPSNPSEELTVRELLNEKGDVWQLKLIAGENGTGRGIKTNELCRPGLLFAGYEEHFARNRIQIIGMAEWSYLNHLDPEKRKDAITRLFKYSEIPAIIIAKELKPFELMIKLADEKDIPLISSKLATTLLEHFMSDYLWRRLAISVTMHADLLNVYGVGVLIGGKSGVGKSETALDLIYRGHALIADDIVRIIQYPPGRLLGLSAVRPEAMEIRNMLHVRGVGLVDVFNLFGIRAIRTESPIDVYIELIRFNDDEVLRNKNGFVGIEGFEAGGTEILGVKIPKFQIIVDPKKNAATLIEVIALNHIMKLEGRDALEEVEEIFKRQSGQR